MPFVLDDLRQNIKSRTIYVGNQPVNVKINPSAVTQTKLDDYRDASKDEDYDRMAAIFREIVVWWDITEHKDGPEIEINGENLANMPSLVTALIWDEINKLVLPKSRKKNES